MGFVLAMPSLDSALHELSTRVLLSMLLALSQTAPSALAPDPAFHNVLFGRVQAVCGDVGTRSTSVMSKSISLLIKAGSYDVSSLPVLVSAIGNPLC